ncbi:hypothetical protein C1I95_18630 [Micromonospora craterilacus]|uniref:Anaphase-promoting complex subunit 5 domain-containing protein n=1 Tax=Micromonospora craterilacus TaxID=1655439 RepID=A0A2W2DZR8_9ACTN|nr:tetratricopeptide repeat protein [Micromonospora craterilacus]PZG15903.1 hypothetical protein C1I95_18630 [Micromonospora craterilacus]
MLLTVRIAALRPLTRHHPLRYGRRLAEALVTRSQHSATATTERTAAANEAVELYRRLDRDQPDRHRVGLARALVAQAAVPDDRTLSSTVALTCEAIDHLEDADDRAAVVVQAEARWLAAACLHATGLVRDALVLAYQARASWLRSEPSGVADRVALVRTLILIGDCRAALGRPEEALAAHQEAMDRYRAIPLLRQGRWAAIRFPAAVALAESLAAVGRWDDALALAEQFHLELDNKLALRLKPLWARQLLGQLLRVMASCQEELGEPEAARQAAEEAVDHQRCLAEAAAPGHEKGLAEALHTLGTLLAGAGRRAEAADRLTEAVDVAREADDDDDILSRALLSLAEVSLAMGERTAAEPLLAEVVSVGRMHDEELPERWRPRLVSALTLTCRMWAIEPLPAEMEPDAVDRGLAAGRESVELARKLASADKRYRELLCNSLVHLEDALDRAGDPLGGIELLREYVAIRRDLFADDPEDERLDLAEALGALGERLYALDRLDEAADAEQSCVALLRDGGTEIPPEALATALRELAQTWHRLGRTAEAERVAAEAAVIESGVPVD